MRLMPRPQAESRSIRQAAQMQRSAVNTDDEVRHVQESDQLDQTPSLLIGHGQIADTVVGKERRLPLLVQVNDDAIPHRA